MLNTKLRTNEVTELTMGIYIHIPFCKSRCKYCDFFSTTQLNRRKEYVNTLLQEIQLRKEEIQQHPIQTIYFGGGTPSLLDITDIESILQLINASSQPSTTPPCRKTEMNEITLEANPQDLTLEKLTAYKNIGINRLSIGIQSFHDHHLRLLGRRHTAQEAIQAVEWAKEAGFTNISIDLIYGMPNQTIDEWREDIRQAIDLNVPHISTYNLIYEEGTHLTQMLNNGAISILDEDLENEMYELIVERLKANGYLHYEVSNFCRPNYHSRHNSSYWNNTPYIGLGAGAHSFTQVDASPQRSWNISDLNIYINSIQQGILPQESEFLTSKDCYNEKVMLSLRTIWGLDLTTLSPGEETYCLQQADKYIKNGLLIQQNNYLIASLKGSEILNQIIQELMID